MVALVWLLPLAAGASVWDYNGPSIFDAASYCVDYGYPRAEGCHGGYYQDPYYYGGGYGYYQQPSYYYYPQPQPQYYNPQQYSYYNNNYPQVNYQPISYSYVVPTVTINSGYYGGGYGGGYWY